MTGRVVCFGELLLRLGAPGREALLRSPVLDVHVGGAEANVAVSLARFGHRAAVVGTVADNALGDAAVGELRRHGVDVDGIGRTRGRMGLYFLETGAGHRPSRVLYDRAASAFALADPGRYDWPTLLRGADWLHVSGVTPALGRGTTDAVLDAVRTANGAGTRVSFDGNYRQKLWAEWDGEPRPILHPLLAGADIAFADHRDIDMILGADADRAADASPEQAVLAAAQRAFAAFPRLQRLATTLRTQHSVDEHALAGLLVARDGAVARAPPRSLSHIVDRIGAGDAFAAGVLHGLLSGMDDGDSLRFGLAAACLKHSVPGDFNVVDASDVAALVREERLDVRR